MCRCCLCNGTADPKLQKDTRPLEGVLSACRHPCFRPRAASPHRHLGLNGEGADWLRPEGWCRSSPSWNCFLKKPQRATALVYDDAVKLQPSSASVANALLAIVRKCFSPLGFRKPEQSPFDQRSDSRALCGFSAYPPSVTKIVYFGQLRSFPKDQTLVDIAIKGSNRLGAPVRHVRHKDRERGLAIALPGAVADGLFLYRHLLWDKHPVSLEQKGRTSKREPIWRRRQRRPTLPCPALISAARHSGVPLTVMLASGSRGLLLPR